MKKALVIGAGLGGLTTALRLKSKGFDVEVVEKYHQAGGRLNQLKKDGFTFDLAPTSISMRSEFAEFADYCGFDLPFKLIELDELYSVNFSGSDRRYTIYKDLKKMAREFDGVEVDFETKMEKFLEGAARLFSDVEYRIIKKNHNTIFGYLRTLASVPIRHSPILLRTMWDELNRHFDSSEVKVIFSLAAFFLGVTPFDTPAISKILSYTELQHDGYFMVKGGMYNMVEGLLEEFNRQGIKIHYDTEIVNFVEKNDRISNFIDRAGNRWKADVYVVNADAAYFRGHILKRPEFNEEKLSKMYWTLAPFTMYLGVKGEIPILDYQSYFVGTDFKEYSSKIFKNEVSLDKPCYYVQASSLLCPESAPEGHESLTIVCPVPDLRYKSSWPDSDKLANTIIADLSERVDFDIAANLVSKTVINPIEWEKMFNLYKGSGFGLAQNLTQVGGFRPKNTDEEYDNLYYVGASTVPGAELPMVVIGSKLVTEQILSRNQSV